MKPIICFIVESSSDFSLNVLEIPPIMSLISFNLIRPFFYFLSLISKRTVPISSKVYFLAIRAMFSKSFLLTSFYLSLIKSCRSLRYSNYSWVAPSTTALKMSSLNFLKSFWVEFMRSATWVHSDISFLS